MRSTLKRDVTLKDGRKFFKGEDAKVNFVGDSILSITASNDTFKIRASKGYKTLEGFCKPPSIATLERWCNDGVAKSITGDRCEPDGYGDENSPSWLLVLGYI